MMKKCIIFICGILINNKSSFESLFNNVIKPNSNKFKFQLVVNTSYKYRKTSKWKDNNIIKYDKYSYEKRLIELIKLNINKDLEYILNDLIIGYLDIPNDITEKGRGSHIPWYRLREIFKENKYYDYDFYIYFRPDSVISKNININNHINNLSIVTSKKSVGGGEDHNRDWDLMFMGNEKLFKIYIYTYMKSILVHYGGGGNLLMKDNTVKGIQINFERLNQRDFEKTTKKVGLIPDKDHSRSGIVNIFNYMIDNGYKVRVLDDEKIFVNVIRDSKPFDIYKKNNNCLFIIFIIMIIIIYYKIRE